jgi:threonyl-tRNA synthetase
MSTENEPLASSPSTAERLHRVRHGLSHVMAQAVLQLRPGTKLGFGPPIDDGFYYDFVLSAPLSEADFPAIEARMREILRSGQKFSREDVVPDEALSRLDAMGEPYKRVYAEELLGQKQMPFLSFYRNGPFVDMCEGPHVETTNEIPEDAFKIKSLAGAYWRGNSKNVMMTRLYAWAFLTRVELDEHVRAFEEAAARDHKKLGRELEIFAFDDDVGKGLPLWLPNGTVIRDELETLMKELEFDAGFQRVATPHVAKIELYYRTGHLPYYAEHMFPFMEAIDRDPDGAPVKEPGAKQIFCLKPMNCPHHHKIFAARKRSYRELPLRLAEYGQCYRYEDSGAVSGLLRVRGLCMNDAHIYCTREQIASECAAVLEMHRHVYQILGLRRWQVRFSTRDQGSNATGKYVDNRAAWEDSERILRHVLVESGLPFVEGPGEAAFYGPKIDFQFKTLTGREETASTLQLDFAVPERLGLSYVGADGAEHRPFVIHRAPLGTHERFVALLLEHFGGAFPTWLAPVQVRVLPVSERHLEYGRSIVRSLRSKRVRAEVDDDSDNISKKVRSATIVKIPNMLIVGDREQAEGTVTLRRYAAKEQQTMPVAVFEARVHEAIASRTLGWP